MEIVVADHTRRFTDRAEYYAAYRAGYPDAVWEQLQRQIDFDAEALVVDVGSGTGLSSELFLRHGHTVYGVEPNLAMRRLGEALLRHWPGFHSINGRAEATTLASGSADLVVSASSFHWFEPERARDEFGRILRPGGTAVVMVNRRRRDGTPFLRALDRLCRRYAAPAPAREHVEERIPVLFSTARPRTLKFAYSEILDYQALKGRMLSYSSIPLPGHERHDPMTRKLREIVETVSPDGYVTFETELTAYWGQLD